MTRQSSAEPGRAGQRANWGKFRKPRRGGSGRATAWQTDIPTGGGGRNMRLTSARGGSASTIWPYTSYACLAMELDKMLATAQTLSLFFFFFWWRDGASS